MRIPLGLGLLVLVCAGCGDAAMDDSTGGVDSMGGDDTSAGSTVDVSLAYTGTDVVDATPDGPGDNVWYLADGGDSLCVGPMDGSTDAACLRGSIYSTRNLTFDDSSEDIVVSTARNEPGNAAVVIGIAVAVAGAVLSYLGSKSAVADEPWVYLDETLPYQPSALDSMGNDIYFSGFDPDSGTPGVFKVPLDGGTVTPVHTGYPEVPSGIVVADDGTVYAAAAGALYEGTTTIATGLTLGAPAGLALTPDDSTVMVSSLASDGSSQALLVNRADHSQTPFNQGISQNVGSGGLHRAQQDASAYAWCGVTTGGGGAIYRIEF